MTPPLVAAAVETLAALEAARVRACVIGGLAVQRWGEPRATQDVDLSVAAVVGEEGRILDLLLDHFSARRDHARAFALEHRVLLLWATNGVAVDVALAASPFEMEVFDRASAWEIETGLSFATCSAEDLVIYKLIAARSRDVTDIEGIVRRQGRRLDADRIRAYAALFAELAENPDLARPFEQAWSHR